MPAPAPAPTAPPTRVPQPETVRPSIKIPSTTPVIRVFFIILPPFCSTIRKKGPDRSHAGRARLSMCYLLRSRRNSRRSCFNSSWSLRSWFRSLRSSCRSSRNSSRLAPLRRSRRSSRLSSNSSFRSWRSLSLSPSISRRSLFISFLWSYLPHQRFHQLSSSASAGTTETINDPAKSPPKTTGFNCLRFIKPPLTFGPGGPLLTARPLPSQSEVSFSAGLNIFDRDECHARCPGSAPHPQRSCVGSLHDDGHIPVAVSLLVSLYNRFAD